MSKLSPWAKARWIVLLSALAALAQPLACSDDEGRLPGTDLGGGPTGQAPNVGPCSEGASAECTVTLGENNGVLSCYKGTQSCESGTWGECGDGSEFTMPVPEFLEQARRGSALSPLALSAPSACLTNPCDPYCRQFDEIPDASLTPLLDHHTPPLPEAGLPLDWPQGSFNRYPPWLITQVQNEPCTTAADCQMNTYCQNPDIGTCAHHQCVVGGALANACNPCVQRICAATPSCCTTSWTQACVDAVDTVCGVECGTGPPTSDGTCVPWFPLQTDAECATFDLTVGPTCHDGTNAVIPVCNHGSDWAPPGIKLIHLPAGQLGTTTNPDQTGAVTCTVDEPIAPGWCISVTNCTGLTNDREIMVNPADGTQNAQECQLEDNWSVYRNVSCGLPICSGATSRAITRKVNMFFVVDKSGSMDDGAPPTAWFSMRQALKTFFSDPNSEGIYTALRFFPDDVPTAGCNGTACSATACANPRAEGELLYELAPTDTHEQNLINILNTAVPNGGTPISPALQGAVNWAQARQALRPNEEYVVVLVTDGNPTECTTTQSGIEAIAAGGAATGIRTYVIGIEGVAQTFVTGVAAAGQGQGFFVSTSTSDVAGQLVDALQTIASQSVPCDYSLPNPGAFDPAAASVLFTPSEAPPAFTPACAADQVEADGRCYYVIQETASSWTNARDMCRSLGQGWDIARIRSDAGNTAVRSQEASTRLWIGGSDRATEGVWTWPDGTQFWQGSGPGSSVGGLYANWGSGEPNASGDEDCIEMLASGANSGFWNDNSCANTGRKPACEGPRIGETVDGCNPGEVLGPDGNCYVLVTANQSWTAARDACRARGSGWDLAKVTSSSMDAWLAAQTVTTDTWIGSNNLDTDTTWEWADNSDFCQIGTQCPAGSVQDASGRCYRVITTAASWTSAQTTCRAFGTGWDLVKIDNASENNFVDTEIGASDSWIGATDVNRENVWLWSDNTTFWVGGPAGACASNWTLSTTSNLCFRRETTSREWVDQRDSGCPSIPGFTLAKIRDATEQSIATALLSGSNAWIGANDRTTEGTFQWWSDSTTVTTASWSPGQPDNFSGEDCVELWTPSGLWNDNECASSGARRPAICEGPLSGAFGGAYANWLSGQPDNVAPSGGEGDCGYMEAATGQWLDGNCTVTRQAVCEGPGFGGCGSVGGAYVNWSAAEPNGSGNCARMYQDGTWADMVCTNTYDSICQGPRPSVITTPPPTTLTNVPDAASCTGNNDEWYYDNPADPTTLTLCPSACTSVREDRQGRLSVEIECKPTFDNPGLFDAPPPTPMVTTFTEVYTSDCAEGEQPQWQFLAWSGAAPGDSRVLFEARTAPTAAELTMSIYTTVGAAESSSGTEDCLMAGPSPCPKSLFTALGAPDNIRPVMELQITLFPGSANEVPQLDDWQVTFTCQPAE